MKHQVIRILSIIFTAAMLSGMTAGVKAESGNTVTVDNGIPVLYLNIDESIETIEDMHNSDDHSVYCYGTLTLTVPENFHYADFPDVELESLNDLEMSIRGRGNSTWKMSNKKPYKIKLENKTDVLGLGSNKHWVLIANDFDDTLMKDRITAWLGDELGFAFTPRGVPVDVVMTGKRFGSHYLGSYYLSENVRVDKNRLNIAELDKDDVDPDIITGGYLLQNAAQVRDGSPDRFFTSRGVDWATHTPSFDVEEESLSSAPEDGETGFVGRELGDGYVNNAQQQYIQNYMQMVEDVLFDGMISYRKYFDVENAAKYWLVNEISMNNDAYATGSTYIYKDRDSSGDSRLYWGPLWDFDFAWTRNFIYTGFSSGHKWNKPMFYDKEEGGFLQAVKTCWPEMKQALEEMIAPEGLIDQYRNEVRDSALSDHSTLNPGQPFRYDEAIDELKIWIRNRIDWVDANFGELDELVHKVTFIADGEVYAYDFREEAEYLTGREDYPEKDGYTFMGWMDEDGKVIEGNIEVDRDMVVTAKYVPYDSLTHATDIAFRKTSDVIRNSFMMKFYQIQYVILPEDAEDQRIRWTSSDINVAGISENGSVHYYGPGEVTFTAELNSGKVRTFTLTILEMNDDPDPYPEAIYPEEEKITLNIGEQAPFIIKTEPVMAKIYNYEYVSDDPEVVTVGEFGELTAIAQGETRVRVRIRSINADEEDFYLETYVTVLVQDTEPEPQPGPEPQPAPQPETKPEYQIPVTGIE